MKRLTKKEFIEKAKKVHGDKYDYSKVEYINNHTKVCIICPEHGEFWQEPSNHLKGCICSFCGQKKRNESEKYTTEDFVEKAKKVHGDKYDYSKTTYSGCYEKVKIICLLHGEFWQSATSHLGGCGCQICGNRKKCTTEEFIEKAKKIHGDKYDYTKCNYINAHTKVCIICHKCDKNGNEHGEFWQSPSNHTNYGRGCPKCRTYKLEEEIRIFLDKNNINYETQKTFQWLREENGKKVLDFYLPEYKAAIECQGIQHFKPTDFASGGKDWAEQKLKSTRKSDEEKRLLCEKNGVKLFYYSNLGIKYPYKVFENKDELLNNIKNYDQLQGRRP